MDEMSDSENKSNENIVHSDSASEVTFSAVEETTAEEMSPTVIGIEQISLNTVNHNFDFSEEFPVSVQVLEKDGINIDKFEQIIPIAGRNIKKPTSSKIDATKTITSSSDVVINSSKLSPSSIKKPKQIIPTSILIKNDSKSKNQTNNKKSHPRQVKHISFAENTAPPRETTIALSITKHENSEQSGCIEYFIEIFRGGRLWTVIKRYRHFEKLSRDLRKENEMFLLDLPNLPHKRWFAKQRWLNRFDENFTLERRIALQEYLRFILKNKFHIYHSPIFRSFLNIPTDDILPPPEGEGGGGAGGDGDGNNIASPNPSLNPNDVLEEILKSQIPTAARKPFLLNISSLRNIRIKKHNNNNNTNTNDNNINDDDNNNSNSKKTGLDNQEEKIINSENKSDCGKNSELDEVIGENKEGVLKSSSKVTVRAIIAEPMVSKATPETSPLNLRARDSLATAAAAAHANAHANAAAGLKGDAKIHGNKKILRRQDIDKLGYERISGTEKHNNYLGNLKTCDV